ncbi:hypothetical protein HUB98_23955 [Paenibacillus barcinonensis]|uniref:Uncharacterized protein n=1 Tax=Paenibacillus barcinonensis TaxID=198119 RepID=A0A2V4W329_PAEBA|nr:hypothetical protein [Paenibacillus barcinonensis]PYE45535.1 hypothetical protein DFQ00_11983 [Paenibacillus barcinonensis]QKS58963.1 hypothetical protein HUB98_23955 [Paenibacillus barcinonensis]
MYSTLRYTLESDGTTYENDGINASLLVELITNLELQEYVVLEPSELVEGSMYMQAAALGEPGQMVAEIRLQEGEHGFRHYSYTTADTTMVIQWFLDYWGKQQLPQLESWKDITLELS